jgi:exodeoxyribonuclease V beta subunit
VNDATREPALLDWRAMPLSGRVLIEASAGTGKTWNIGLIFLRLILEQSLPVEKIIVVTFTEAAAQELRERLRGRLVEAERCLQRLAEAGPCATAIEDGELDAWLAGTYAGAAAGLALRRVQLARLDIDRAPIATIHALCQRVLREFPIDADSAFGVDRLFDETELLRECLEDFWRRRYLHDTFDISEDEVLAAGPERLLFDVKDLLTRNARVLPLDVAATSRARVLFDAYAFCAEQIPLRALARDGRTYSMLIDEVHTRIIASPAFADRLFDAFPAALIDESQDTDTRQFAIFDRIYREETGKPRGLLAMIGDPKQAIYAFRGGDIAAYKLARSQASARFALAQNQRSSSALIAACNALYAQGEGGFADPQIRYRPVSAAGRADQVPYSGTAPFVIHAFRGDAGNGKGGALEAVGELEAVALDDCACRIVELLQEPVHRIGGKRVAPGDIAVLLPQNRQVGELRQRLLARGVPCVGSGRGSVFDTKVAQELELVLYAVLHVEDERAVRGALATRLLGRVYADLAAWQTDQGAAAFETELARFAQWRDIAHTRGILAVLGAITAERGASLLTLPDGERWLTDLRHLGEALAEKEALSGLDGAYAWFAAIRREGDDAEIDAAQTRQLRLESDAQRVQLMTLHAAKGLEFPIVFLPLAWRVTERWRRPPKVLYFHDGQDEACADIGSATFAANRAQHDREDLQERMRLLYVALTRAIHAVHVYWVDRKEAATPAAECQVPAIDRLIRSALQGLGLNVGEDSLGAMAQRLGHMALAGPCTGTKTAHLSGDEAQHVRRVREPLPQLRPFLWLHSFSSLTRQGVAATLDTAAADEGEAGEVDGRTEAEVDPHLLDLDVWRGRRFGDAVHRILQDGLDRPIDRNTLAARFAGMAVRTPGQSGREAFAPVLAMLERTRSSDLGDGLRLVELPASARVAEFEFQLPITVSLQRLREITARHGCPDVIAAPLGATMLNGMLTGFADLIFEFAGRYHVLDYKTNRLGASLSDYRDGALAAAMNTHRYTLQALLYTVALHRYLRVRLPDYSPERHLGESWYLFLRAIGLHAGAGVWRRRWSVALIEALDAAFAAEEIPA